MLYSNLNGMNQDYSPVKTIKIILDHGDDVSNDTEYNLIKHKLESRGINLHAVIINAVGLLRSSGYSFIMYHDALNQKASSIRMGSKWQSSQTYNNYKDNVDYLEEVFAPIPKDYSYSGATGPKEADIKWMLNYYHDFLKERQFNPWINPVRVFVQANMLIIEGWYDVY